MKHLLVGLLFFTFIGKVIYSEDTSVAAGNSAGQSPEVMADDTAAGGEHISRPDQMSLWSAVRLGSDAVKLTFSFPLGGNQPFDQPVFFRATSPGAWEQVTLNFSSIPDTYAYDSNAPAGNEYRYVLCLKRPYRGDQVYSKPSEIRMVADTNCRLRVDEAGTVRNLQDDTGLAGHLMVSEFLEDTPSTGQTAPPPPNPYDVPLENHPNTVVNHYWNYGEWWVTQEVSVTGFLATGKILDLSGICSAPASNTTAGFDYPTLGFDTTNTLGLSNLNTAGVPNNGGRFVLDLAGMHLAAYRMEFSGNANEGYDSASYPNCQMIPLPGASLPLSPRDVTFKILPDWNGFPVASYILRAASIITFADPVSGGAGENVHPGDNIRRITDNDDFNVPGTTGVWVDGMGGMLVCDVRKRREIKVKIVNVRLTYPTGSSIANPGDRTTPRSQWVTERNELILHAQDTAPVSQVQTEMNDTFGKQANVWITVSEDPTTMIVDDLDACLTMEEADAAGHPLRTKALQNRISGTGQFTLFRIAGKTGRVIGGTVLVDLFASRVNFIGALDSLFANMSILAGSKAYAHEVGHLLGLHHTWVAPNPETPSSESLIPDDARRRIMCYDH